ncbi:hypothetical protein EVAR_38836_1 [Eumeta japonica]|uniref:Uncharacterized protein n=1 Tax=Eumeta variegata TaxID=151549 RepID=A0A4C1XTI9_EUMVA|nr:hypothetical protein EVAR_38836_1 [Eumeta japonica]
MFYTDAKASDKPFIRVGIRDYIVSRDTPEADGPSSRPQTRIPLASLARLACLSVVQNHQLTRRSGLPDRVAGRHGTEGAVAEGEEEEGSSPPQRAKLVWYLLHIGQLRAGFEERRRRCLMKEDLLVAAFELS